MSEGYRRSVVEESSPLHEHDHEAPLVLDELRHQLDQFRNRGIGSREETGNWMHAFSEVLTAPPCIEA